MKNVSRLLALAVIVTAFASCGVLRKNKQKQQHTLEESSRKDSIDISKTATIGEVKEQTIDKGTIVTEREVTTTTTKPATKVDATVNKKDLKHGDNFIRDSAGLLVNMIVDTLKGTLRVQFDQPGETVSKTEKEKITEKKDKTTDRQEKKSDKQEKQVAVTGEQRRSEKTSSSTSNSQPSATGIIGNWIGLAIAVLMVLIGVAWWFFGIRKKKTENRKNNSKD